MLCATRRDQDTDALPKPIMLANHIRMQKANILTKGIAASRLNEPENRVSIDISLLDIGCCSIFGPIYLGQFGNCQIL